MASDGRGRTGEFSDSPMVVGELAAPASPLEDRAAVKARPTPTRWAMALGLLVVISGGLAVAAWTGGDGLVEARLLSETRALPDAPAGPVEPVWSEDLGELDAATLVGDTIVVVQHAAGGDPDADVSTVIARDLETGRTRWSRSVPGGPKLFIVGTDGRPHWPQPGNFAAEEPSDRIMGVSVLDGHTLWDLPWAPGLTDFNVHTGRMVGAHDGNCQQIDVATGEVMWSIPGSRCGWGDRDRVLVGNGDHWQLHDADANLIAVVPNTDRPPTVVDDLLVSADSGQVVAYGLDGQPRWRTDIPFDIPEIEVLPGRGLLVGQWFGEDNRYETTALDLQGNELNYDTSMLSQADLVELDDGRQLGVALPLGLPSRVTFQIVDLDDPGQVVATRRSSTGRLELVADVTRQGLLLLTQPRPERAVIELVGWPDATTVWQVDLPTGAFDVETGPPTILTSDSGLVVMTGGMISEHKAMHVYR